MPISKWLKNMGKMDRDNAGDDVIFRNVGNNPHTPIDPKTGDVLVGGNGEKAFDNTEKPARIKVSEITSPIYNDMVLSNGRRVKDIITRAVEMPLRGSTGAEHIESHPERKGMVAHYIGMMNDIINDPDYVFEDKSYDNSIMIGKEIDESIFMIVSLNFDNPSYTNTLITLWNGNLNKIKRKYEKIGKVLYKKE